MPHGMDKKRAVSPRRQPVFCRQTHRYTPHRLPTPQRAAEHARLPSLSALRSVLFACPPSRPYALTRWAPIPPHRPPVTPPRPELWTVFLPSCTVPQRRSTRHKLPVSPYAANMLVTAGRRPMCAVSPSASPSASPSYRPDNPPPSAYQKAARSHRRCGALPVSHRPRQKKHKRAAPQGSSPFVVI